MNPFRNKKKICLKDYLPSKIWNGKNNKCFDLKMIEDENHLTLYYVVDSYNHTGKVGIKSYNTVLPKFLSKNPETFVVLGLLQAEMGKKQDGKIVFCNHEYKLINKVISWFEKEFDFSKDNWKWYIKVNINEPVNTDYKKEVENKVINHWIKQTGVKLDNAYPKKVSYIKNTTNKELKFYDYGTLIIEKKSNLFSQVIKALVKTITQTILDFENAEITQYMRGIIAGESNVEVDKKIGHFRIFISAKDPNERLLFQNCLKKLDVNSTFYQNFNGLVVSKKQNHIKLLKQNLMTLSPKKYARFLYMLEQYENFEEHSVWKKNLQKPHNKISKEKIEEIIELYNLHSDWPAWKIAKRVGGVSDIKVMRVRKELIKEGN